MVYTIFGTFLILIGLTVNIIFWLPGIINRNRLKEIMGKRYPLVYLIYIANGPLLILFGTLLIIWPRI